MRELDIKKEFSNWIDKGRHDVWFKFRLEQNVWKLWTPEQVCWNSYDIHYVVNDELAEVKKAWLDGKDIEMKTPSGRWVDVDIPSFDGTFEYRIKAELDTKERDLQSCEEQLKELQNTLQELLTMIDKLHFDTLEININEN